MGQRSREGPSLGLMLEMSVAEPDNRLPFEFRTSKCSSRPSTFVAVVQSQMKWQLVAGPVLMW